jgi:hypothetical protein
MAKIIEVVVSPKGETIVETKGYTGSDCQLASKWLEQGLGVVADDRLTAQYYQTETSQQQIQQ